jgi:hypothetical protein
VVCQAGKGEGSRKIRRERKALRPLAFMLRLRLKKRIGKLRYVHMYPVQRGLPAHPKDWPWSSFLFDSKSTQALVRIVPLR